MRTISALLVSAVIASTGAAAFAETAPRSAAAPVTKQEIHKTVKTNTATKVLKSEQKAPADVK